MSRARSEPTGLPGVHANRGRMTILLAAVFAVMLGYGVTLTVLPY